MSNGLDFHIRYSFDAILIPFERKIKSMFPKDFEEIIIVIAFI